MQPIVAPINIADSGPQVAAAIEEAAIVIRGAWTAAAPVAEAIAVGAAGVATRIFAPLVVVTKDMFRKPYELEPGAVY